MLNETTHFFFALLINDEALGVNHRQYYYTLSLRVPRKFPVLGRSVALSCATGALGAAQNHVVGSSSGTRKLHYQAQPSYPWRQNPSLMYTKEPALEATS